MKHGLTPIKCTLAILLPLAIVIALALAAPPQVIMAMTDAGAAGTIYSQSPADGTQSGASGASASEAATAPAAGAKLSLTNPAAPSSAVTTEAPDTTAPSIFNQDPANGALVGPSKVLGYDYSDPSGVMWPDAVHLYVDGACSRTLPGTTDITATGIRYTPAVPLTDGNHKLKAMLCDNLLNCRTLNWTYNVDALAPVAVSTSPTGTINTPTTTISATLEDPTMSGSTSSNVDAAGVTVSLDGTDITPNCTITSTSLSCPSGYLSDSSHSVSVDIPDNVGNHGSASWSFTVDAAAIGITEEKPVPFDWLTTATPPIGADFQQVGPNPIDTGSVHLLLDGNDVTSQATVTGNSVLYVPPDPIAEGDHLVEVSVADSAGHAGAGSWHFLVDTESPTISNINPDGLTINGRPTISAAFNDLLCSINPAFVKIFVDGNDQTGSADVSGNVVSFTPESDLVQGPHTVQVTAMDIAGNISTRTWNFTVPVPPPASAPPLPPQPGYTTQMIEYWQSYFSPASLVRVGPGNWIVSGFSTSPNSYFLPWFDSKDDGSGRKTEIAIANEGGGEAFVSLFIGGQDRWHGNIAEGAEEVRQLAGIADGPVKVVSPTGQPLKVELRITSGSTVSTIPAVPMEDLEPVWLLPWYDPHPAGDTGSSSIAIANAGNEEASVDVYMGDQGAQDSLKGHYQIKAGGAVLAELKDAGGVVKIISTNNQPILVSEISRNGNTVSFMPGTGLSHLGNRFEFKGSDSDETGTGAGGRLYLGNGNEEEIRVAVFSGGQELNDPDNPNNEYFLLEKGEARAISLPDPRVDVRVECTACGFGVGLVAARAGNE